MELIINRYNQTTPTAIASSGVSISTPVYIKLTSDQSKQYLNAFRKVVAKERSELGYDDTPKTVGQLAVETKTTPPLTPSEQELGMTEDSIRYALFSRQGTPERLILKLSKITGVYVTTRQEIEQVFSLWLDEWYPTDEQSKAKTTSQTSKKTKPSRTTKTKTDTPSSTTTELV